MTRFYGQNQVSIHPCLACGRRTSNSRVCADCFKRNRQLAIIANSGRRDADEALRLLREGARST